MNKDLAATLAAPQIKSQLAAGVPADQEVTPEQLDQMAQAQAPMMLAGFVQQGFLTESPQGYQLKASYDNGALTLNGNPFPLGALMGQ